MRSLRTKGYVAMAVVMFVGGAAEVGMSPPASAYSAKAVQLNICGSACHIAGNSNFRGNNYGYQLLEYFVSLESPAPWLISANEVCDWQAAHLDSTFSSLGTYHPAYRLSKQYDMTCDGGYGDVVFTVGPNIGGARQYYFSASTYNGGTYPSEKRQIVCQTKQSFGFSWDGCTLHTVTSNAGDPGAQSAEARFISGSISNQIVAGDFNHSPYPTGWPDLWEGDYPSTKKTALLATTSDNTVETKIDYVFSPTAWFPASNAATSCSTSSAAAATAIYTDHCYLSATYVN